MAVRIARQRWGFEWHMLGVVNDSFDVAVVGLGPAGAACAALLGGMGVKAVAIERSREVYDKPRAFALDHEVMRVFEDIGIAEAAAPHTAPFTPSEYYGADGQLIKRLGALPPPWPLGWPPSMVFDQPAIEALLRKRAAMVAQVVHDEVVGVDLADDFVRLRLRDGKPLSARYVVACDGAGSTVRKLLGIEYEDLAFDQEWMVVDLRVGERGLAKLPQVSIQYCEPERPATYLIGVGSHRRWSAGSPRRTRSCGAPRPTASMRWWRRTGAAAACSWPAMPRTSSRRSPARACARESGTWPT
jgi:3-(3-hydroxy-phenyl)propionate hydroxylase